MASERMHISPADLGEQAKQPYSVIYVGMLRLVGNLCAGRSLRALWVLTLVNTELCPSSPGFLLGPLRSRSGTQAQREKEVT